MAGNLVLPGDPEFEQWIVGEDGIRRPRGTVQEDPTKVAVHICKDGFRPALCGAFGNQPPQAWPKWARWVRLDGKIYLSNCHKCQTLAGATEQPGEWR